MTRDSWRVRHQRRGGQLPIGRHMAHEVLHLAEGFAYLSACLASFPSLGAAGGNDGAQGTAANSGEDNERPVGHGVKVAKAAGAVAGFWPDGSA